MVNDRENYEHDIFINILSYTQVVGTYQLDSDKWSHLSDPYMNLRLDKAATSNHLHFQSRSFLQGFIQYYRTKQNTLNMSLPQMWLSACQFNNYSSEVQHVTHICNQNNNQNICSTNFCLLSSNHINKPAPGFISWGSWLLLILAAQNVIEWLCVQHVAACVHA